MISTISNWLNQSAENGAEYLSQAADQIERLYPEASQGEKAVAAATLAQAMATSALAYAVNGQAEDSPLAHALARYCGEEL